MSVVGKKGYKETKVGWIPLAWSSCQLAELAAVRKGKGTALKGTHCIELEHLEQESGRLLGWDASGSQASIKSRFSKGDVLFGKLRPYLRKYAIAPFDGLCTTEILAIYPMGKAIDGKFLFYLMQGEGVFGTVHALSYGTKMPRVSWGDLSEIFVACPPVGEQQKIAAILSSVDDKLDIIAKQIEATQTLKRGLMQTLFSRGVGTQDENGRWVSHTEFKDSELGEIPAGWKVSRLDAVAEAITVGIATSTTEHYVEDGVPLIRNQNIREDFLDMTNLLKISPFFDEKNKNKRVVAGDILTVRTGYPGVSCVVPEGLGRVQTFTTLITRLKKNKLNPNFASRYFNSDQGKALMLHQAAGGAQQNINAGNLKKLLVPLPPLAEQEKISLVIEGVELKIRCLQDKHIKYSSLKSGLMQKLLTGEWRVKAEESESAIMADVEPELA